MVQQRPPYNISTRGSASLFNVEKLLSSESTRQARNTTHGSHRDTDTAETRVNKLPPLEQPRPQRNVLQSWHGVVCWKTMVRNSNEKQNISVNAQNAVTSVSSSWLSKTTVLMMKSCTCEYNNANEFLRLSTTICMSMRPWAEINPVDARLSDFCKSCAKQPVLTNHSRRKSKFDSFGSSPCAWLS